MKFFIELKFGYYPFIWMLRGRGVNNKISHLLERSLCIVYQENSSFKELLKKDNSCTGHHRNIQSLAIELFTVKENLLNTVMNNILQIRTLTYNLRSQTNFASFVNTSGFGLNSLHYLPQKCETYYCGILRMQIIFIFLKLNKEINRRNNNNK